MRTLFPLLLAFLCFSSRSWSQGNSSSSCAEAPTALRIATFNVMSTEVGSAGKYPPWETRLATLTDWVRREEVDIAGFQEVLQPMADDIRGALSSHEIFGRGRGITPRSGEQVPILFRSARFSKEDGGTFWLSSTPWFPGSKGWDAAHPRIASWVRLKDQLTGRDFFVFNTHLDNQGRRARTEGAKVLAGRIREIAGESPVILLGDFNSRENDAPFEALGFLRFARRISRTPPREPARTSAGGRRIDHLLLSPDWSVCSFETFSLRTKDGRLVSDHLPVSARVLISP